MGSPYNTSPASAISATWWSLMENSDTSDDESQLQGGGRRKLALRPATRSRTAFGSPTYPNIGTEAAGVPGTSLARRTGGNSSSSRRSSSPLPQHASQKLPTKSVEKHFTKRRMVGRSYSDKALKHAPRAPSRTASRFSSPPSSSPPPSLDEEDYEQKRIRWETPTTHRYQLAEQPRLLEEKILNVLDSVQSNMVCSQNLDKPTLGGRVWNLLESDEHNRQDFRGSIRRNDSNSQGKCSDDDDSDGSAFEDGPSVVEITGNPPVFSESITASESLFSSQDSEDENYHERNDPTKRRHGLSTKHASTESRDDTAVTPADSSQILDDLSCMESERKGVEYDNSPAKIPQEQPIVVNNDDRPPVKIYSTSMPFEPTKEKKCIVSMGKLQDIHKARSDAVAARKRYEANKRVHAALRKKLKDCPHIPPIPDISVEHSNEVSTMSASEDSYMYQTKNTCNLYKRGTAHEKTAPPVGVVPENKGLHVESNAKLLFDSRYQDETRSCIPIRLQRKKRGVDGATASSSSKSQGLRILGRSGDANTTFEKENDTSHLHTYEYDSGVNTYVAYFEISKNETHSALQAIEHPNPPLLPFGSNEVVVKIEASTISQSDCAIRRGEWWGGTLSLPRIPGVAFAGKIDQVHKIGRNGMQRGDQVLSLVCSGSNSRYVCIPRERLVKVPSKVTLDAATLACLPEIYLSAFQVLHHGQNNGARYRKSALSGKSIMFVGGASAFGQAIVELSVEAGVSVVYATATKVKQFQRIIAMGGIPLSDKPAEWLPSINQQIDILIGCTSDILRDTDPLSYDHLNVLKKQGQLILLGGPGAPNDDHLIIYDDKGQYQLDVLKRLKKAHKHNVFESWEHDMKQGKRDMTHLIGLLNKGVLKPKILERISLSKVSKAEDIVEARRLHGVIICEPWIREKQR